MYGYVCISIHTHLIYGMKIYEWMYTCMKCSFIHQSSIDGWDSKMALSFVGEQWTYDKHKLAETYSYIDCCKTSQSFKIIRQAKMMLGSEDPRIWWFLLWWEPCQLSQYHRCSA